jgi:hypothetical protein
MKILQWQHTVTLQVNFCTPVLIFKKLNKTQVLGGVFHSGSDLYVNRKSSGIGTDLPISWLTKHILKHKASRKVVLLSDGHRAYCNSLLLLHTAVENNVTIIPLQCHYTHTL